MAAPGTTFKGPVISGPRFNADNAGPANTGLCVLSQTLTLNQNGADTNVSGTFTIPSHCQILDFLVDGLTVWDSATSAGLTIGTAALGTQYASSINVKTNTRAVAPVSPSAAQLLALSDTGTNKSVVVTVAVVGATTAGKTVVTMRYIQTTAFE